MQLINYVHTYVLQIKDNRSPCVNFTPCQYKNIYYSRLPRRRDTPSGHELDALCLLQMAARNWQNKTNICKLTDKQ